MKISAVVVTYNRKVLLKECLEALIKQTRPIDEIIVIDNASTDGTEHMMRTEFLNVTYVRLPENIGGAGGFHEGIKLAYEKGYDWIWVMDDDTIPMPDSLFFLVSACNTLDYNKVGFICSRVMWIDNLSHIMNIPQVKILFKTNLENFCTFDEYIDNGLLRVSSCSFVSVLFSRHAIKIVGLPIKEMFVYCDDIEFTRRVSSYFNCYYSFKSRVIHKTKNNIGVDIEKIESQKLWYCFYDVRNKTYLNYKKGFIFLMKYFLIEWFQILKKAFKRKDERIVAISICIKGFLAGLFFNPRIIKL